MSTPALEHSSPRATCAKLNRLVQAGVDESSVLGAAARVMQGDARRRRLQHQALRRSAFSSELGQVIIALGGEPAARTSPWAKISGAARRFHQILTGGHEGDAYAACVRAAAKTSDVYVRALDTSLPAAVRGVVERDLVEIASDLRELNRLRFGASPMVSTEMEGDGLEARTRSQRSDERAIGAWNDEGGAAVRG